MISKLKRNTFGKISKKQVNKGRKTLVLNNKKILKKKRIYDTKFVGDGLDLIFGLMYLAIKHKNLSIPISFSHSYGIKKNNIIDIMDAGLRFDCQSNERTQKLYYPINKTDFFRLITESKKRFHAIFIYIKWNCANNSAHFNMLVFDKQNKTVERFEPYTDFTNTKLNKIVDKFDKKITKDIKKYLNYDFLKPNEFCPTVGFQQKEEDNLIYSDNNIDVLKGKTKGGILRKSDPGGFCGAWSLYFLDLKLTYPDYNTGKLLEKAFSALQKDKHSFRSFIRNYSDFIIDQRYKMVRKYNYNSNFSESNAFPLLQNKFTEIIKRK